MIPLQAHVLRANDLLEREGFTWKIREIEFIKSDDRAFRQVLLQGLKAFHRWLEGTGQDVIVVATLAEDTWYSYEIGFPFAGPWREVFNSDVYDNWVNPIVAGNGGKIWASGPPLHGFQTSATIVIPANGFVVFART